MKGDKLQVKPSSSWWFQPIWKILVKMGSSSANRDENKNHHLVIQLFSSGKFLEMNRWRSNEWEFQDANEFPMIRCPIDISYTGFAIITWNNTKKKMRNPTSPRDNTCQSLGLIFPCNKVLVVDPVISRVQMPDANKAGCSDLKRPFEVRTRSLRLINRHSNVWISSWESYKYSHYV